MSSTEGKRCYMVGVLPPPLGGVSVFVYRYSHLLRQQGYQVINIMKGPGPVCRSRIVRRLMYCLETAWDMTQLFFGSRDALFYANDFNQYCAAAILLRPWRTRLIYHCHSAVSVRRIRGWRRWLFQSLLNKAEKILLVRDLRDEFKQLQLRLPDKVEIRYAFLPPPLDEEAAIRTTYDIQTETFLNGHSPCIIANAFAIRFFDGQDLYGLDMVVKALPTLVEIYPNLGILVALANVDDESYVCDLRLLASRLGVVGHLCFMTGQKELWPLFKQSDLMVRPTNTDGDAVSIREAMYFGCPVVASDAAVRPEGVVTFPSRDQEGFEHAVIETLGRSVRPKMAQGN